MGRIRTFLELGLASGAALGILAITLPQFLGGEANAGPSGTTPIVSQAPMATAPQQTPDIAHFLGIAQFVKSPTKYGFSCELACDPANATATGDVVSASLEGDLMEIEYSYPTADRLHTVKLIGKLNSDGVFEGIYQNDSEGPQAEGNISFTFAADGTAQGSHDKGKGTVRIFL